MTAQRETSPTSGLQRETPPTSALANERLIGLRTAAALLPPTRHGWPVRLSCIVRWIGRGLLIPSGERVRLEAIRHDGHWLTSGEAVNRFAAQVRHVSGAV
jgi:hypothetical protein